MRQREELLWGGGVLAALGLLAWKGPELVTATVDVIKRGGLLTHTRAVAGIVPDDPDDLVEAAAAALGRDVDRDAYSLARMGRSEGVNGMAYRMHVACNDLAALQATYGTGIYSSLTALMLRSKSHPEANGHYSEQGLGKRYATIHDPYAGDLQLAEKVLADRQNGIDLAEGATKFYDKSSGGGVQAGTTTYDAQAAIWAEEGYQPFNVDGATDDFVLFRKA